MKIGITKKLCKDFKICTNTYSSANSILHELFKVLSRASRHHPIDNENASDYLLITQTSVSTSPCFRHPESQGFEIWSQLWLNALLSLGKCRGSSGHRGEKKLETPVLNLFLLLMMLTYLIRVRKVGD